MGVQCVIFTGMTRESGFHRTAGAYRIATELRDAGFTVQVIDFLPYWTDEELYRAIIKFVDADTLAIAFSSTFFQNANAAARSDPTRTIPKSDSTLSMIRTMVHELSPKAKFIMGGALAHLQLDPVIDYFLVGYADQMVVDLMCHLRDPETYTIRTRPSLHPTAQLLDWHDYPIIEPQNRVIRWHESDFIFPNEALPIEISRGCIFRCKFCAYPLNGKHKNDYVKDPAVLRDEMIENNTRFGTTRYTYVDDTHNDTVAKLEQLDRVYAGLPFRIEYSTYLRLDLIHARPETALMMRDNGLRSTFFGIESIHHESAKAIGKGLDTAKQIEMLRWLHDDVWRDDVAICIGLILGLPHDSPEVIDATYKFLTDRNRPFHGFAVGPLSLNTRAGDRAFLSELDRQPERFGYEITDEGWRTPQLTEREAKWIVRMMDRPTRRFNRPVGMVYMSYRNAGFSHADLLKHMKNRRFFNILKIKQTALISEYKRRVLA